MRWRSVTLVLLFAMAFILVSGANGCEAEDESPDGLYLGGTQGVEASFVEGKPGDQVYPNQPFDITVNFVNKGEAQSHTSLVSLSGVDASAFGIRQLDKISSVVIEGRSRLNPDLYDENQIRFSNVAYKYQTSVDVPITIKADYCYEYSTDAVAQICLKKNVYESDDGCTVGEVSNFENSGGPIQITSLDAKPSGTNQMKITFIVENQGAGDVYMKAAFDKECRNQESKKDKVHLKIDSQKIIPIKCSKLGDKKEGEVSLSGSRRLVSCTLDTKELQGISFNERFTFNVYYMYRDSLIKDINIKSVGI